MEKQKVGVKMTVSLPEAVEYLENLLAGLKSGSIEVRSGEQSVTLVPADMVAMEIEAKVKKGKRKFAYELAWTDPAEAVVTVGEPAPAPAEPASAKVEKTEAEAPAESGKEKKDSTKEAKKAVKSAKASASGKQADKADKAKRDKKDKKDSKREKQSSKTSAAGDDPKGRDKIPAAGKTPE